MMETKLDRITELIRSIGGTGEVGPDDDFYDAGFSSIKALELLLELETAFDVSIPDDRFVEVRTPRSIEQLITHLSDDPG